MPSIRKPARKPEEILDLLAQGDTNSIEAINDLTEALEEYKKDEDSSVAKILFERAKVRIDASKRFYWEAGIIDPFPFNPPPRPRPGPSNDPTPSP